MMPASSIIPLIALAAIALWLLYEWRHNPNHLDKWWRDDIDLEDRP